MKQEAIIIPIMEISMGASTVCSSGSFRFCSSEETLHLFDCRLRHMSTTGIVLFAVRDQFVLHFVQRFRWRLASGPHDRDLAVAESGEQLDEGGAVVNGVFHDKNGLLAGQINPSPVRPTPGRHEDYRD